MKCLVPIVIVVAVCALVSQPVTAGGPFERYTARFGPKNEEKAAPDETPPRDKSISSFRDRWRQHSDQTPKNGSDSQVRIEPNPGVKSRFAPRHITPPGERQRSNAWSRFVRPPNDGIADASDGSKPRIQPKNKGPRGGRPGPGPGSELESIEDVAVRFMCLVCREECTTDRFSDSDEPYYLIGVVDADGKATVERSRVFSDVDGGENRPVAGVANDIVWRGRVKLPAYFTVVLMEHDASDVDATRNSFDALTRAYAEFETRTRWEKWEVYASLGLCAILSEFTDFSNDEIIGKPQGFTFSAADVDRWQRTSTEYGVGEIRSWAFRGHGADYGLMFQFK